MIQGQVTDFVWSPTGDRIAFSYATELRVIDLASGTVTPLAGMGGANSLWALEFSPDGKKILFTRADSSYGVALDRRRRRLRSSSSRSWELRGRLAVARLIQQDASPAGGLSGSSGTSRGRGANCHLSEHDVAFALHHSCTTRQKYSEVVLGTRSHSLRAGQARPACFGRPYKAKVGGSSPSAPTDESLVSAVAPHPPCRSPTRVVRPQRQAATGPPLRRGDRSFAPTLQPLASGDKTGDATCAQEEGQSK